jgi:hypothetical protein
VALLEKRRYLNNRSGDFPQVILIVPSHVPNTYYTKQMKHSTWVSRLSPKRPRRALGRRSMVKRWAVRRPRFLDMSEARGSPRFFRFCTISRTPLLLNQKYFKASEMEK